MNTNETRQYVQTNNIDFLIADYTDYSPEIKQLMQELGNEAAAIPFYAVFPGHGGPAETFTGFPLTQGKLIEHLDRALNNQNVAGSVSNHNVIQ